MVRTKIEVNPAIVRSISGVDDTAKVFFPDNQNHRRAFVAIWVELKYAEDQFLPSFSPLCQRHEFSERVMETVRAKMKKMGILKRISHFNPRHGHTSGWTFSDRCRSSLNRLAAILKQTKAPTGRATDEQKDRDSIAYV